MTNAAAMRTRLHNTAKFSQLLVRAITASSAHDTVMAFLVTANLDELQKLADSGVTARMFRQFLLNLYIGMVEEDSIDPECLEEGEVLPTISIPMEDNETNSDYMMRVGIPLKRFNELCKMYNVTSTMAIVGDIE